MMIRSQPWETEEGWEEIVARPVIKYPMAPRHAAAILEIAGRAMRVGVSARLIFNQIAKTFLPDCVVDPQKWLEERTKQEGAEG